jgi:hypothetical protein
MVADDHRLSPLLTHPIELYAHDTPFVKLPAQRAGLPGKEISFILCPLTPAYKAGFAGHVPVKNFRTQNYLQPLPLFQSAVLPISPNG